MEVSGDPASHVEPVHRSSGWGAVLSVQQHQLLLGTDGTPLQHSLQLKEPEREREGRPEGRFNDSAGFISRRFSETNCGTLKPQQPSPWRREQRGGTIMTPLTCHQADYTPPPGGRPCCLNPSSTIRTSRDE